MPNSIQYPFALDETNTLVSVQDINPELRYEHSYTCPCCNRPMHPRLGEYRVWHFYHSDNQLCSEESYIHLVAKLILQQRFNRKELPFIVEYETNVVCDQRNACSLFQYDYCYHSVRRKRNLQDEYDLPAVIEPTIHNKHGLFKPDVCLRSSKEGLKDIFIEVWYKHKSTAKKISSEKPIIEFHITSEQVLIALQMQESFSECDRIQFYNFTEDACRDAFSDQFVPCKRQIVERIVPYSRVSFYPSGSPVHSKVMSPDDPHDVLAVFEITYRADQMPRSFSAEELVVRNNIIYRNCYLCVHCKKESLTEKEPATCELKRVEKIWEDRNQRMAQKCDCFIVKPLSQESTVEKRKKEPVDYDQYFRERDYDLWLNPRFSPDKYPKLQ